MKATLLLAKVFFLSGFNVGKTRKNGRRGMSGLRMMLLFGFVFFLLSFALNSMIGPLMAKESLYGEYLALMIGSSALLTFAISMFSMQNVFFKNNDYEFLQSLPVSKTSIVAAKILSSYALNLFEDLVIALPSCVIFMVISKNVVGGLLGILAIALISFIPLFFASLIGVVQAVISAKSEKETLFTTIFSLLFVVCYVVGVSMLQNITGAQMGQAVHGVFLLEWMYQGITLQGPLSFLFFVLVSLGSAFFGILILSLLYRPLNDMLQSGRKHVVYTGENGQGQNASIQKTLLRKEKDFLLKRPNFLVNSYLGQVLMVVFSLLFIFGYRIFLKGDAEIKEEDVETVRIVFYFTVPAFSMMFNSMSAATSAAISLEGREGYELLRSYPLDPNRIISAKMSIANRAGMIINLAGVLLIEGSFAIMGVKDPLLYVLSAVYPFLALLTVNEVGMLCGLKHPKLDFENDTQVVKNSAAANLTALFGMLISLVAMGGYLGFVLAGTFMENMAFLRFIGAAYPLLVYGIIYPLLRHHRIKYGARLLEENYTR